MNWTSTWTWKLTLTKKKHWWSQCFLIDFKMIERWWLGIEATLSFNLYFCHKSKDWKRRNRYLFLRFVFNVSAYIRYFTNKQQQHQFVNIFRKGTHTPYTTFLTHIFCFFFFFQILTPHINESMKCIFFVRMHLDN